MRRRRRWLPPGFEHASIQGIPWNVTMPEIGQIGPTLHRDGTVSFYDPIERVYLSHVVPTPRQLANRFGSIDHPSALRVREHVSI